MKIPTPAEIEAANKAHEDKELAQREVRRMEILEAEVNATSTILFGIPMACPVSASRIHKDVAEGVASKARASGWRAVVEKLTYDGVSNDYTYRVTIEGPAK